MRAGSAPATPSTAPSSPTPLALVLLTACYYLIANASLMLAFAHTNATPVWPPSGIAFAAVLLMGHGAWPAILLGALAANLSTFTTNGLPFTTGLVTASLLIAVGNTLEALAGAWLMRRYTDTSRPLRQLQDVYKFAIVALLVCLISAGIGSTTLVLGGLVPAGAFNTVALTWWVGDVAGMLLVAPAILAWRRRRWRWPAALEAALSLLLLAALIAWIFGRRYTSDDDPGWLPYLFMVCVAWASYRYGLRGATLSCVATAGGAVLCTVRGLGPFAVGTLNDALIALDSFVVLCSVIGMVLCADASERRRMSGSVRGRSAAQWATLLVGLGLTVVVWHLVALNTERRARQQFDTECGDITERISARMALYESGLRGARALFNAEPEPSRAQWRGYVEALNLQHSFPGVMGLGYSPLVQAEQRDALERQVRAQGHPDFRIWTRPGAGLGAASVPVLYLEPFQGQNLRAFGYDMMSEPIRRAALLEAARTGEPVLSAKVTLVQNDTGEGRPGFLMYFPIHRKQEGPAPRIETLQGYTTSPIRADDMMAGLLGPSGQVVLLEIFDGPDTAPAGRLYASGDRSDNDKLQYPNPYLRTAPLVLLHHRWTLRFTSLPAFENSIDRQKSHIVLLAGAIISLLFFGVVRALTARQAYAAALAEEKTAALRESESSLITARDLAEAASRAKSEFVANMSHEIRTPLNAVLGMTHLLNNTALSPDQQKYLEMIRSSGNSLLSILNDVLDFSKIEAGRMELAPAPFQLSAVLEAIATIMTVNSGEKDLELAIGVEADVPQSLVGDGHRLQQILINLVGNAIKFTEKGSVTVLVERAGGGEDGPVTLRFTVRDSGIGIPPDQLAQLFAPFSQADASMTRRFGGTGLGLAISRRIAALMGGEIAVHSDAGVGSAFMLTVPLQRGADLPQAGTPLPAQHLLVVDDDAVSADYLCRTIGARGWSCERAGSGEQALALLRAAAARYDAILVDWDMRGMNGLETMQAIRAAMPQDCPAIILMVSAFGQGKLLHTDGADAANAVLLKPVTMARLNETLQQALAGTPVAASADAGAPAGQRIDGVRILLVEDNPINQLVAKSMLSYAGAHIEAVDNGRAALELLRTEAHRYDLVLMDVQMPEMDGFEATTRIRNELKLELPVLAMTAGVMLSEREQCIASGMNDFIAKPIDVEQMLRAITRNLPAAQRAAAGR
ncbi:response regulator [Rugamonas sp. FT107W]|uniref:Virulence sensor protein BvgS n=1 Tax=Duganella vulcania TaxID=2692166 RepID=A0A845HGT7_9BURK|nr:CHASE domain-containing protein [Duganella vulcania]MYN18010.1 response regulator [Duganella vulcania]